MQIRLGQAIYLAQNDFHHKGLVPNEQTRLDFMKKVEWWFTLEHHLEEALILSKLETAKVPTKSETTEISGLRFVDAHTLSLLQAGKIEPSDLILE